MATRYHGKKGKVYLSTTGTGNATDFGSLTAWSLDMSTDVVDVTCFGDTTKVTVQGLPSANGSFDGVFDTSNFTNLYTASQSTDGVKLYLYPSSDAPTFYFYGPAWLQFSISDPVGDKVSISAKFSPNGSWGAKP